MAIGIHVARVNFTAVDATGTVRSKSNYGTPLYQFMETSHQHIVMANSAIPNTTGQPTVDAYLILEAASGYVLRYMDQNMIVTYDQSQLNSA